MSIWGIIAALAMLSVLLLYILRPLLQSATSGSTTQDRQRDRALAYYERVLTNIRDLDEDHITGKIADDEYASEREVWVQRGSKLLKLMDDLDTQQTIVDSADDADIDRAIEAAIAAHKQQVQEVS
ncbi:MAG: hypothetical protein Q9P01_06555 [Anaerolineae bacterium]|nr:hypothetical protein [Anaerolineae bacterium]MDQ7034493.1 hypothetical protein [Anaerolineae bacterium]